jgi:nicotinamide mononucleotide (NMN) deamidase PncC
LISLKRNLLLERHHHLWGGDGLPPHFSAGFSQGTLIVELMLISLEQLVQQIHDSRTRIVLAAAGGGSRAIADLLEVPGGSRTLLEAIVPYSVPAMAAFLGGPPDEYCSEAAARAMAMAAFLRARKYQETNEKLFGLACTASLASDRPKRGPHRIHIALQTAQQTACLLLQLQKDRRSRAEEERVAGRLLLNALAQACGIPQQLTLDLLEGEHAEESCVEAPPEWQALLSGDVESVCIGPSDKPPKIIFPGAFNPLHAGHRRMAQLAGEMLHEPVAPEISILNVDKPPLDYMEIQRRLGQFAPQQTVYLTRAATFEEKSRLFPGATFVVGADTLRRIADPQYYGGDSTACHAAVERIAGRGCRFLLFGRLLDGGFARLSDLDLPDTLAALCREVPPEVFREDVCSTDIRKAQ